jgi:transposase
MNDPIHYTEKLINLKINDLWAHKIGNEKLISVLIRNSNQDQLFNLIKHNILKNLCQNHQKLEQN